MGILVSQKSIATGLRQLADDFITCDRVADGISWYSWVDGEEATTCTPKIEELHGGPVPIVPRAIHAAMCPSMSIAIQDLTHEIVVCANCALAVENGAA